MEGELISAAVFVYFHAAVVCLLFSVHNNGKSKGKGKWAAWLIATLHVVIALWLVPWWKNLMACLVKSQLLQYKRKTQMMVLPPTLSKTNFEVAMILQEKNK